MSRPATFEALLDDFAARATVRATDAALQQQMQALASGGFTALPMPGQGRTLDRWRTLAAVAGCDLSLTKLFEGHTDALAILAEIEPSRPPAEGIWGVWAAEPPFARVTIVDRQGDRVYVQGRKAWCSGAPFLNGALMTTWDEQSRPQLVAVALDQPSIRMSDEGWQATGMGSTASVDVEFKGALASCVGSPGQYLQRPGFWQGGAGIAACWYGAACALGHYLREHCTRAPHDEHAQAHLGAVDATLCSAAAALRETADWIDRHPRDSAERVVRRVRAQVETSATQVLHHVGRALGATPYCRNSHFARLAADLPVFLRQSHGEKDLAALGACMATGPDGEWSL